MTLSERSRSKRFQYFSATEVGEEAISDMLSQFPVNEVDEPVTKAFLRSEFALLRLELRNEMIDLRDDLRTEFQSEIGGLRAEFGDRLSAEVGGLRGEFGDRLSAEVGGLRGEFGDRLSAEIGGLRGEFGDRLSAEIGGLRGEFGDRLSAEIGGLRSEIGGLRAEMRQQLYWMIGSMIVIFGVLVSVMVALG